MDKTLAAIYAVSGTGKSSGYKADTNKSHVAPEKEQENTAKNYFNKLKNLVDRLRR